MSAQKTLTRGPFECKPIHVRHGWVDRMLCWFFSKSPGAPAEHVAYDWEVRAWVQKHCASPFNHTGTVLLQCQLEAYHQFHKILP